MKDVHNNNKTVVNCPEYADANELAKLIDGLNENEKMAAVYLIKGMLLEKELLDIPTGGKLN